MGLNSVLFPIFWKITLLVVRNVETRVDSDIYRFGAHVKSQS